MTSIKLIYFLKKNVLISEKVLSSGNSVAFVHTTQVQQCLDVIQDWDIE